MLQGAFSVTGQELLELLSTAKRIRGARLAEVLKEDMWPIDQKTSKSEVSITAFEVVFFARVELNSQEELRVELNSQELLWVCHVTSPGNHSEFTTRDFCNFQRQNNSLNCAVC